MKLIQQVLDLTLTCAESVELLDLRDCICKLGETHLQRVVDILERNQYTQVLFKGLNQDEKGIKLKRFDLLSQPGAFDRRLSDSGITIIWSKQYSKHPTRFIMCVS